MYKFSKYFIMMVTVIVFGCGGGGSSGGGSSDSNHQSSDPSTYSIQGQMLFNGAPLSGVTVTISAGITEALGDTTTTDADGNYTFTGMEDGTYTITPSLAGYAFDPASNTVTVNGSNITANVDTAFVASLAAGTYNYTINSRPTFMDHDSHGNMWVVNFDTASVVKVSPTGDIVDTYVLGTRPQVSLWDIAIDRSTDTAWVVSSSKVFKLDSDGNVITTYDGSAMNSLVIDYMKNIWVSCGANGTAGMVFKINSDGSMGSTYDIGNGYGPAAMTVDHTNNIWVCNYYNASISKITQAGVVTTYSSNCTFPKDIAVDNSGNVWLTSYSDGAIVKIGSNGSHESSYAVAGACYLSFDSNDSLFVTCHISGSNINSVKKFSAAGILQDTYTLAGTGQVLPIIHIDGSDNVWVTNPNVVNTITEMVF